MAENKTTTPALITQVMTVGLAVEASAMLARRPFFAEEWLRSLDGLDRRFARGADWTSRGEYAAGCGVGPCRGVRVGTVASAPTASSLTSPPIATDSGTKRKEDGWPREGLACEGGGSDLGRPRAAAAQESKVDRLARRAAS